MNFVKSLFFYLAFFFIAPTFAQESNFEFGGDVIAAGETSNILTNVTNDVFAVGNNINVDANVAGDSHTIGRAVSIHGNVGGNVYAGGDTVIISGQVGKDILASGNSVIVGDKAVGGNVRLMGNHVTLNAPVSGNVLIGASKGVINSTIEGDVEFYGGDLVFGDNAKIIGLLQIKGPSEIDVPSRVISPERVNFIQTNSSENSGQIDHMVRNTFLSFWPGFLSGFGLIVIAFLIGIIWLALMPDRSTMAYMVSKEKPIKSLFIGILWLSMFFGLLIVLGMSLIGIPLILIAILVAFLAWVMGYVGGAYFLAARIIEAFGQRIESLGFQVIALAFGLILAFVFSLIPFIGWLSQLALVFFGLGAMGLAFIYRKVDAPIHSQLHDRLKNE